MSEEFPQMTEEQRAQYAALSPAQQRAFLRKAEAVISADTPERPKRSYTHRLVEAFGEAKGLAGWARDARCAEGVTRKVLYHRIFRCHWNPEEAIVTSLQPNVLLAHEISYPKGY